MTSNANNDRISWCMSTTPFLLLTNTAYWPDFWKNSTPNMEDLSDRVFYPGSKTTSPFSPY